MGYGVDRGSQGQRVEQMARKLRLEAEGGLYHVINRGNYRADIFRSERTKGAFLKCLGEACEKTGWRVHGWCMMSNHYHFIATSPADPSTLKKFLGKLHMTTSKQLNKWDGAGGRKVWFQYWDSQITFERSYLARLNYIHHNPAHHGVVEKAENYPWCSMAWFAQNASPAFVTTVNNFKTDKLEIQDDF